MHYDRGRHEARFLKQSEDETILHGNSIEEPGHIEGQTGPGVFSLGAAFARRYARQLLGISALVLAPCFWHRTIVASDLGSHVYNAWLTQLIRQGQAPGLWLATRWDNVLFDCLLDFFGRFFSLGMAEKISVSLSGLVFFWGVFAFVCAAARRAPWFLIPCIAMVSYGYTFHMGFLNYYISLGLGFWGVAIFWRGRGWERIVPILLVPIIMLANPLGR